LSLPCAPHDDISYALTYGYMIDVTLLILVLGLYIIKLALSLNMI
jgi:hypothetical protein